MKYFQIEGSINEELFNNFIHFFNENEEEEMSFVINSGGGKATLTQVMLHIINANKESITLISCGSYSAAFDLFYKAECNRKLVHGSLGCVHLAYLKETAVMIDGKMKYYEDICQKENFKCFDDSYITKLLKPKEKILYNRGDDVFFTFKRMQEIFPDVEVI